MSSSETLAARYRDGIERGLLQPDPGQAKALERLEALRVRLDAASARGLIDRLRRRWPPVTGVYLWGAVGRGKTMLMDLFERSLRDLPRQRLHFHRFMGRVHEALRKRRGERDPLARIAADWAGRVRLLCLDEFMVVDIGDAMLLAGLLRGLFERGVSLVATSNLPPRELYRGGLQRARFEPAIALIESHCEVVEIEAGEDHRLRALAATPSYLVPADCRAEAALADIFRRLAGSDGEGPGSIELLGRRVPYRRRAADLIWFDFEVLCGESRGTGDYLELARSFHTLFVSGIPFLGEDMDDPARRLVHLVDALYDHGVKLFASAAALPAMLYRGGRLAGEFQRTASRLVEMQGGTYLARPHRP